MLKQRVITASILAILFLLALFKLPLFGWVALVGLIVMQGAWEWSRLAKMSAPINWVYLGFMLLSYVILLWLYLSVDQSQKFVMQMTVYGAAVVFWLLLVPIWLKGIWKTESLVGLSVVGWLVLLPTAMAMLDLREASPHPWWLLGVMALVWMADVAAYFAGRRFGKNKLAPTVSPGKTWEGVAGGALGVTLYMLVVLAVSGMMQHYGLLLLALVGVALSVVGDLFESAIKRQAGVKDSGTLLPGHGGLLDRIDALTSTLPIASISLILFNYI